ncbi:putative Ig domain-containing protein, partial [Acidovorax soli]|uniref:putative Ig domain-containing protein n=1 Tax=Acidovorax soli TaxID=592050 RepID=UPI0032B2F915
GVTLFTRNTDTGTLTSAGSFDAASSTANNGLVLRGDNLYISTATGLQLYQRDNGAWVQRDLEVAPGDGSARFTALQFSADGQLLFAATLGGNTLASVFRVSSDGTLTHLANATDVGGEHYANALALSTDGKTLYVAEGGWLHTFTVDTNGSLTKRGTALTLDSTTIRQIMVSPDDAAVIVVGEIGGDGGSKGRIELFTRGNDGALALRERLDAFGNMDDWDNYLSLQEIRSATLSADGTQLYIAGAFNDEQVLVIDLQPQRSVFIEGEGAVALMPGGTLADAQLDALGNYQGASITVQREGGARAGDVLGFIDGAGLSLQNGQILLNGAAVASFVVDSAGQLTLRFTANVTRADAQQILRRIAYSSSNQDLTGGGATANYQVVFHDGDGYSATQRVALAIEGRNDAPVVTSTALTPTFKAGGEAVKLFENTQIDTVEAGQKVWKIIVTLNAVDPDDVLGVGAEQISLRNLGSGIQTTPGGMEYVVVVDNGTTSIHLMVDGTGQRAATLVDSLSYRHAGEASTGSRQISLQVSESVEWNPSVPSNSTSTLGSQAQVILTHEAKPPINQAPVAGTDAYLPSSITAGAAYSTTLPDSLFVDAEGDPLQWRVDGLPAGLTFDSGTRSITGTLDTNSAAAQYSITVTVRDSQGREASRSFALQVLAAQVPDPGPGTDPATPPGTGSGSAPGAGSNPGLVGEPTPTLLPSGAGFPNERDSQRERNTDEAPANGAVALPLGLPTPWRAATPAVAPNIALPATATLPDRLVLPPQEAPMDSMALRFADGSSSPVVTLADGEGPALSARQPLLAGAWSRDLGGNRLVFDLPEGFISTRTAIDSLTLRNADGRALPAGVRLDIKNGRVVLVGSPATALNLQLVVTAVDGQTLTLRLQIEAPPATERTPAPQNEESSEAPLAKTTLSEQLRHRATSDLLRQAQELLDDLAHEAT